MGDYITVTLVVKPGEGARREILNRLNDWFTSGPHDAPYPPGTLLSYSIHGDGKEARQ